MELWEKILVGALGVLILFMFSPGIKVALQKSKDAQEKHWGTLALLAAILVVFVILLISLAQS